MEKPTKIESHYHLPNTCCATCKYARYNSYNDSVCDLLQSGNTIDAGGICDYHTPEASIGTNNPM